MDASAVDLVDDPVGHISISGVHGRKELEERLASQPASGRDGRPVAIGRIVAGALIGAALAYMLERRSAAD